MSQQLSDVSRPAVESIRTQTIVDTFNTGIGPIAIIIALLFAVTVIGVPFSVGTLKASAVMSRGRRQLKSVKIAKESFPGFIGSTPKFMDLTPVDVGPRMKKVTASGIAYADGRLFVLENGVAAEIPWSRVRSWTWKIEGYETTQLFGGGASERLANLARNEHAAREAVQASGFTISTKEIEKPEWRFTCCNEQILKKWMEILAQMKSGDLPAR